MAMNDVLRKLSDVLEQRKKADPEQSYVASLHAKGLDKILQKIGEESTEVILAAKTPDGSDQSHVIRETADLWFHCLVMLSHLDLSADDVLEELEQRFGLSGIDEKASRNQTDSAGSKN